MFHLVSIFQFIRNIRKILSVSIWLVQVAVELLKKVCCIYNNFNLNSY